MSDEDSGEHSSPSRQESEEDGETLTLDDENADPQYEQVTMNLFGEICWFVDRTTEYRNSLMDALHKAREGKAPVFCVNGDCQVYWWVPQEHIHSVPGIDEQYCSTCEESHRMIDELETVSL